MVPTNASTKYEIVIQKGDRKFRVRFSARRPRSLCEMDREMTTINPKRGFRFLHSRWIEPDTKEPMHFEVTRIANGGVYYRAVAHDGRLIGNPEFCEAEQFVRVCKQPAT